MPHRQDPTPRRTALDRPGLRGAVHHLLPLAAAALAVLVSAAAVATLCTVSARAVLDGVRGQLAEDPRTAVTVQADYRAEGFRAADRAVRAALARALDAADPRVDSAFRTATPLTTTRPDGRGALPSGTTLLPLAGDGTRRNAVITEGAWPDEAPAPDEDPAAGPVGAGPAGATTAEGPAAAPVPAALPQELVRRLALRPGDTLRLTTPSNRTLTLRITGSYRVAPGSEAFWRSLGEGAETVASRAAVVAPGAFLRTPALTERSLAVWTGLPRLTTLRPEGLAALHERVSGLASGDANRAVYRQAAPALASTTVRTELPHALADTSLPALAARSSLYVPVTLLTALAALTLLLTTRQLAEHRRAEQVLRLARGVGARRLLAASAAEWAVVALPAAAVGVLLARPAAAALTGRADLGALPPAGAFAAVGLILLVHAAGVLAPVARLAVSGGRDSAVRPRSPRRAAAQRTGVDLGLLLLALLGFLQLLHYRGTVAAPSAVGFDSWADPALVLTPAALLAAGALLTLRLLPPLTRVLERRAARATGLAVPLGIWHLGRRSAHATTALLSVLALAVCALSATALASLGPSHVDRAAAEVGADLSVTGGDLPSAARRTAIAAVDGVRAVTPVAELRGDHGNRPVTVVALNTATAERTLSAQTLAPGADAHALPALREDLSDRPPAELLPLLRQGPPTHGLPLPGDPAALDVTATLAADGPVPDGAVRLSLSVQDADGLTTQIGAAWPADGREHTLRLALRPDGTAPAAALPLTLSRVAVLPQPELPNRRSLTLDLRRLTALGPDGPQDAALPAGSTWQSTDPGAGRPEDIGCPGHPPRNPSKPIADTGDDLAGPCSTGEVPGTLLHAVLRTHMPNGLGTSRPPQVTYTPAPQPGQRTVVPVLANDALLSSGAGIGSRIDLTSGNDMLVRARIVGRLAAVPGQPRDRPAVLADLPAIAAHRLLDGAEPVAETRWWAAVAPGAAPSVARALHGRPDLGEVRSLPDAADRLARTPYQQGLRTALWLCLLLAPLFVATGTTVQAAVAARARGREFAVLRALGCAPRLPARVLRTEHLVLTAFSVLAGTGLGLALAAVLLPLIVVDDGALAVFPTLRVTAGWTSAVPAAVGTGVLVAAVTAVLAGWLARTDLARVLRAGEDG
ncbi:FtsX-like permease family protein [Kitasatospora sp. NPDC004240]